MAASCATCANRRRIEYGPGLAAGIVKDICREFCSSRHDPVTGEIEYSDMPCAKALTEWCNFRAYRPTLWERVTRPFKHFCAGLRYGLRLGQSAALSWRACRFNYTKPQHARAALRLLRG